MNRLRFTALFCLLLPGIFFWASCRVNPVVRGPAPALLQGCWSNQMRADLPDSARFISRQYSFRFTGDSVYLRINTRALRDYIGDSCYRKAGMTEFAKGTTLLRKDTLVITGVYTHENYKMKVAGCYRSGYLTYLFKITDSAAGHLTLRNLQEHGLVYLEKTKPGPCRNP